MTLIGHIFTGFAGGARTHDLLVTLIQKFPSGVDYIITLINRGKALPILIYI